MSTQTEPTGNLNHGALVVAVANESGYSTEIVRAVLRATFDVVGRTVAAGFRVSITNFGAWSRKTVRSTHNPQTMEPLGPSSTVKFTGSGRLADAVKAGMPVGTLKKNRSN